MHTESMSVSGSLKVNGVDVQTKYDELIARIEELGNNVVKYNLDCNKKVCIECFVRRSNASL